MERTDLVLRSTLVSSKQGTVSLSKENKGKRWEKVAEAESVLASIRNTTPLETIELNANSYSEEVCAAIADELAKKKECALKNVFFDDMFTRRQQPEVHASIERFTHMLLLQRNLTWFDLR